MDLPAFAKPQPPREVSDLPRWHAIDRLRLRADYWWLASLILKTVGWVLAIATVIVAGIVAGRPPAISAWSDGNVRNWSTVVAILTGLSGLIPWRRAGRSFERAHEVLVEYISLYDSDTKVTVAQVIAGSHEAEKELDTDDRKAPRDISTGAQNKTPPVSHGPHAGNGAQHHGRAFDR